jgi:hypothetical protein
MKDLIVDDSIDIKQGFGKMAEFLPHVSLNPHAPRVTKILQLKANPTKPAQVSMRVPPSTPAAKLTFLGLHPLGYL